MKKYISLILLFYTVNCVAQNQLNKFEIKRQMELVADWQIAHFEQGTGHDRGLDAWTNATLYLGMFSWANEASSDRYFDWLYQITKQNNWQLATQYMYHADALCVGQTYVQLFRKYNEVAIIKPTLDRINWIAVNPPAPNTKYSSWNWSDALFMAPPLYAQLTALTGRLEYIAYMDAEYKATHQLLYDHTNHLFFRDKSYINKKEANGEPVFWGRGNAWVIAGLVNILKTLAYDSPYRDFYLQLYTEMANRLVQLQNTDGFWHASLLDPDSYPSPESSATGLIVYALAYGIQQKILPQSHREALNKAWLALSSVVNEQGKLTWVQPIGADPKKVTQDMTDVFGVGAFLMAGTQMLCFFE